MANFIRGLSKTLNGIAKAGEYLNKLTPDVTGMSNYYENNQYCDSCSKYFNIYDPKAIEEHSNHERLRCKVCWEWYNRSDTAEFEKHQNEVKCNKCYKTYDKRDPKQVDHHENESQCKTCYKYYDQRDQDQVDFHKNEIYCSKCREYYDKRSEDDIAYHQAEIMCNKCYKYYDPGDDEAKSWHDNETRCKTCFQYYNGLDKTARDYHEREIHCKTCYRYFDPGVKQDFIHHLHGHKPTQEQEFLFESLFPEGISSSSEETEKLVPTADTPMAQAAITRQNATVLRLQREKKEREELLRKDTPTYHMEIPTPSEEEVKAIWDYLVERSKATPPVQTHSLSDTEKDPPTLISIDELEKHPKVQQGQQTSGNAINEESIKLLSDGNAKEACKEGAFWVDLKFIYAHNNPVSICITPESTGNYLMKRIGAAVGVDSDMIRMVYAGRQFTYDKVVKEMNIKAGSVIFFMITQPSTTSHTPYV